MVPAVRLLHSDCLVNTDYSQILSTSLLLLLTVFRSLSGTSDAQLNMRVLGNSSNSSLQEAEDQLLFWS